MKNNPPPQKTKSESSGLNKRHAVLACILLGLAILMMPVALEAVTPASPAAVETAVKARLIETYGKLPLSFEANQGQTGAQVKFLSRGAGSTLFLTPTEAVLSLHKRVTHQAQLSEKSVIPGKAAGRDPESMRDTQTKTDWMPASAGMTRAATGDDEPAPVATLRQLVGGNPKPQISGVEELPGKVNYLGVALTLTHQCAVRFRNSTTFSGISTVRL